MQVSVVDLYSDGGTRVVRTNDTRHLAAACAFGHSHLESHEPTPSEVDGHGQAATHLPSSNGVASGGGANGSAGASGQWHIKASRLAAMAQGPLLTGGPV
jgi:uncharacterized membrane protein YgcG